ncbi:gastrula zinc finger protein XlCGF57.1-like [Chrysoperla carnea]|uniref:gastrula zinc finger protein XlCGF57.1-like n=1 Tax=Chrysoperla carnea TaxID=189513 RepID=UPI001D07F715|nr:gastrula zinc finger protein XlCGF57.1-like [Chrysoperla carnea]
MMNQSINIQDFQTICRICLIQRDNMMQTTSEQVVHMLEECTAVHERFREKLPQQICKNCFWQLKNAYDFKQQCTLSLEILCNILLQEEGNHDEKLNENIIPVMKLELNEVIEDDHKDRKIDIKNEIYSTEDDDPEDYNDYTRSNDGNDSFHEDDTDEESSSSEDEEEKDDLSDTPSCENDKTEQKQRSLADILIKKYKIYDLTCNICKKEISTRTTLLRHMEIHDKNRSFKYYCDKCNKGFYAQENLKKHQLRHMGKTKFQCDRCEKRFYVLSALGVHYKSSHKAKPITCPECPQQFYHPLQIEQHHAQTHVEKKFVCEDCGKIFPTKNRLTKHKVFHSEARPHVCTFCTRSFKQKSDLTAHIKKRHDDNERREMCYICGKLVLPGCLTIHLDTHNNKSFKCPQCGKLYASKLILGRHINLKHNNLGEIKKYYCNLCNKALGSKGSLTNHMINIHSEIRKSDCPICGKTYKSQNGVKLHIQSVHKNERPHICQTCNKAFHTKKILEKHIRTHTGERPFSCTICSKAFGFKEVLKTHMKVHSK